MSVNQPNLCCYIAEAMWAVTSLVEFASFRLARFSATCCTATLPAKKSKPPIVYLPLFRCRARQHLRAWLNSNTNNQDQPIELYNDEDKIPYLQQKDFVPISNTGHCIGGSSQTTCGNNPASTKFILHPLATWQSWDAYSLSSYLIGLCSLAQSTHPFVARNNTRSYVLLTNQMLMFSFIPSNIRLVATPASSCWNFIKLNNRLILFKNADVRETLLFALIIILCRIWMHLFCLSSHIGAHEYFSRIKSIVQRVI